MTFDLDDEFEALMRRANPHVPEYSTQYIESRRLFYSGAASVFLHALDLADLSETQAEAGLANLQSQLESFFNDRLIKEAS